ncbi:MAG TPA: hypothetical protein VLS49_01710 [Usitatibacter sp.]|nr:hypothetical protein [Usitatibacter sp.]
MTKFIIFVVGALLLFLMEAGFSLALRRYDLPAERSSFFKGPITATISGIFHRSSARAPAAAAAPHDARTDPHARKSPGSRTRE